MVGYDLPSTFNPRSTSFGFGERSIINRNKNCKFYSFYTKIIFLVIPSPDKYDLKSSFE